MPPLRLSDYARALNIPIPAGENPVIERVENDSRRVKKGTLFCAITGSSSNGKRFIPAAVSSGACAVVAEGDIVPDPGVPVLTVRNAYQAWGILCETEAGFPARDLMLHAVTGTNGKTTTAMLLQKVLSVCGEKCGLLSTVVNDVCGALPPEESAHTTPDARTFQEKLLQMRRNACTAAVMETSSHGLHQYRTGSARFRTAVFTNLTGDHLDYHHDMESYFQAKRILFHELLAPDGTAVINGDDPYGQRLIRELGPRCISFSSGAFPAADARFRIASESAEGTHFEVSFRGKFLNVHTNLIGLHNVRNLCGVLLAAIAAGKDPVRVSEILSQPFAVPGRLERFDLPSGARAFVDFAHTDDALERVLSALRKLIAPGKRLFCVFGCGGDRDRTKRPRMGRAAAQYADKLILTNDNPRSEDPEQIASEIASGIPAGTPYCFEPDREKAIRQTVSEAAEDDLILIAGKGHETTQQIGNVFYPMDDRKLLRELAEKR